MVYKSSFGRGFNSSILNSYVLSVLLCIFFSITLFALSVTDSKTIKFLRFSTISFSKPIFIAVGKPFQIFNSSLIYVNEIMIAKEKNLVLLEENEKLAKELDKKNFLLLENQRLKNLLKVQEVDYVKKITARIFELMPNPLMTTDQLRLLKYDNVVSNSYASNASIGVPAKKNFENEIKKYSYMWKEGGQFSTEKYRF